MANNAPSAFVSMLTVISRLITGLFIIFTSIEKEQILNYKLMVYFCEGNDKEKLDWFGISQYCRGKTN